MDIQNLKRPALRAEDGATFHGSINRLDCASFGASCWALMDSRYQVSIEEPQHLVLPSKAEAEKWIAQQAAIRGFEKWHFEE